MFLSVILYSWVGLVSKNYEIERICLDMENQLLIYKQYQEQQKQYEQAQRQYEQGQQQEQQQHEQYGQEATQWMYVKLLYLQLPIFVYVSVHMIEIFLYISGNCAWQVLGLSILYIIM